MDAHLPRNRRVPDYFRDTVGFIRYQISAAKLQAGSYAVWMGMYAPVTQMRAAVEAAGVVVDNRALLLEFQLAP